MKIISFEGIDGVGKSTIIDHVENYLTEQGYNVLTFIEPGATDMGLELRKLLKSNINRNELTELLMFISARNELVSLIDNLKNVDFVILDRYIDSTLAYQHYGNGTSIDVINWLNHLVTKNSKYLPDFTFYITIPNHVRLKRLQQRQGVLDKFDANEEYLQKVQKGYVEIFKNKQNVFTIENINLSSSVKQITDILINACN